jgi:hypothetical protein
MRQGLKSLADAATNARSQFQWTLATRCAN